METEHDERANGFRLFEGTLLFVFAASGCSGLIYQSVWTGYLGNFLGHAAYAQSLVLAIFMGGMAVGAWLMGRRAERWRDPLRAYAIAEAAIGVLGLLFHQVFVAASAWAFDSVLPGLASPSAVLAFKWTLATLLILPASVLLGTTFPLLSTGVMRRGADGNGRILSGLYFSNSIGAAIGALLATFWLVPAVGMPGAMRAAGVLNLAVAAAAWTLGRRPQVAHTHAAPSAAEATAPRLILFAAAITGASSFVYEIGWVRMLNLVLGTSIHSFELMLAAFIGGLAFGGWALRRRIDRLPSALRAAGVVQVLMGLAALASLALYNKSFDAIAWLVDVLARTPSAYVLFNIGSSAIAIAIMAPAAFFAGMTLPLFTLSLLRAGYGERSVGAVYAANTIGAIVGVFVAMHALIPGVGLMLAMTIGATADLALGLVILRSGAAQARPRILIAATAAASLALLATLALVRFDPQRMASGVYRSGETTLKPNDHVVFQRDGKTASVTFTLSDFHHGSILTNGKVDAGIALDPASAPSPDEYTMTLAAVLPLSMLAQPKSAAVIGFGSGMSTHTLLGDPGLESVDTIEIEPEMVAGARGFGAAVARAYDDPRSHIHFEDAKTFFSTHGKRYDVIVSEPSNPWMTGVASLFSVEFYRFVPRYLTDDGLFVQWLQGYDLDMLLTSTVIKALENSFAHFEIYAANEGDYLIVASVKRPLPALTARAVALEPLAGQLDRLKVRRVADLQVRWLGDERRLGALAALYPISANSDYFPVLGYGAPKTRFTHSGSELMPEMLRWSLGVVANPAPRWPAVGDLSGPVAATARSLYAADEIASSIERGVPAAMPHVDDELLAAYHRIAGACGEPGDPAVTAEALNSVAELVVPFADPARQPGFWSAAPFKCMREVPALRSRIDLYAALGARDHARVRALAAALLDESAKEGADRYLAGYALLAAIASAEAEDDNAAVHPYLLRYGSRVSFAPGNRLGARFLVELAERGKH